MPGGWPRVEAVLPALLLLQAPRTALSALLTRPSPSRPLRPGEGGECREWWWWGQALGWTSLFAPHSSRATMELLLVLVRSVSPGECWCESRGELALPLPLDRGGLSMMAPCWC
jgi:hypothetical protein